MNDILIVLLVLLIYFSPVFYQLFIVIKESKRGNKIPLKRFFRYAKYSLLFFLATAIVFTVLSHTNYLDYEKPMKYDKIDDITFENFRGLEFFKKSLYGNERFAYVVTSIESDISGNEVTIQSFFHPSRSYVYSQHSNSKDLLTHEKYHIKITELYARKAKERIMKLKNPSKKEIKEVITKAKKEERQFQKKYDYDTFHNYVLSEQKKYETQIDSLLNLLTEFEQPKIILND